MVLELAVDVRASTLLQSFAQMPFLDVYESAAIFGVPARTAYRQVHLLTDHGLLVGFSHSLPSQPATARYALTEDGLTSLNAYLRTTTSMPTRPWLVSRQWMRILLRRLDNIAILYRLASAVVVIPDCYPLGMIIRRSGPLDAVIVLPQQQRIGLLKLGHSWGRRSFSRRTSAAIYGDRLDFDALLLVVPSEVEARHTLRHLQAMATSRRVYVATEMDVALANPALACWRAPMLARSPLALSDAVEGVLEVPGYTPAEKQFRRRSSTLTDSNARAIYASSPALTLKAYEKRILTLIADWPLISRRHLATIAEVSPSQVSKVSNSLSRLIEKVRVGDRRVRYVISNTGISYLAQRDRIDITQSLKHWSPEIDPLRRRFKGSKLRELMRTLTHTDSVHDFNAMLVSAVRNTDGRCYLEYLQPPHKSVRSYTYEGRQGALHPDSTGLLAWGRTRLPFMLEFERRARHPSYSADRVAPYSRYFGSDEHQAQGGWSVPLVLTVFDDPVHESQFVNVVWNTMEETGKALPIATTYLSLLRERGALGYAWITPRDYLYQRKRLTDRRLRRMSLDDDLVSKLPDPDSYVGDTPGPAALRRLALTHPPGGDSSSSLLGESPNTPLASKPSGTPLLRLE